MVLQNVMFVIFFCKLKVLFNFAVAKFASEQIAPVVKKMDEEGCIDEKVFKGLFENGVCLSTNFSVNFSLLYRKIVMFILAIVCPSVHGS